MFPCSSKGSFRGFSQGFSQRAGQAVQALLAGLTLTGLLAGCGTQARNAFNVQQYLADAQQAIQVNPTDAQARKDVDQAIAVAPQDADTYFGPSGSQSAASPLPTLSIESVFGDAGDIPALADYMAQATQKFPSDERGFLALDTAQEQLGRTAAQRATAAQLAALLVKKLHTPGTNNLDQLTLELAQAYYDAGDTVSGEAAYKKALQAYPASPLPANNLAYAYAVHGTNLPQALALAHQAIALAQKRDASDVEIATYQDTLGWVQYQMGDYAGAEQNLLQAASVLPRLAEIRYHLGCVYIAQGNMAAARAELGHAVLLAQGYAAAHLALETLPKDTSPKETSPAASPKAAVAATRSVAASR